MSKPKVPELKIPAKAPERAKAVEEGDIELGGEEQLDPAQTGRRSLQRPTGFTGLSV